jgi:hypothetical protein
LAAIPGDPVGLETLFFYMGLIAVYRENNSISSRLHRII